MMDNQETALEIQNVSKRFKLPHQKKNTIKSFFINPFSRYSSEEQVAFKNVSLEIKKGEFFGIVGRNGSGKSTLLKCIAGVYAPDTGSIRVNGKLVPFIELGVGFNPELSGRDNVFLNGALLGFTRKEISAMYNRIVEFAELEKFMDQKLMNYSSGMQVRLAFSIAIQAQGDILLLDEVLAVGDTAFQKKCFDYFAQLKRTKKTVVLVTHDMGAVEKYCDRALLLKDGKVELIGNPQEVSNEYTEANIQSYSKGQEKTEARASRSIARKKGINVKLGSKEKSSKNTFKYQEELELLLSWNSEEIKNIGVALMKDTGEYIFGANTFLDKFPIDDQSVKYRIKLNLAEGKYFFKIGFYGDESSDKIDFIDEGPSFLVSNKNRDDWGGLAYFEHKWSKDV